MLIPTASVSVANTTFTRPVDEARLDHFLERAAPCRRGGRRHRPRAGRRTARSPARRGRRRRSRRAERRRSRRIASRSPSFVSRRPASTQALAAASHCARLKMKKIAGQHRARRASSSTVSTRPGGRELAVAAPAPAVVAASPRSVRDGPARIELQGVAVRATVDERRAAAGAGRCVPVERRSTGCRAATGRWRSTTARVGPAHGADPLRQLVDVADGRRQAHQPDVLRQVDDHLFPHRAAVGVLQEVHLVEHHECEVVEVATARRSCCAAPRWSSRRSVRHR